MKRKLMMLVALVAVATGAWAEDAKVLVAWNIRVEQRFPWNDYVDVRFSISNTLESAKNTNIIARLRGFYDGQMMLDMDHLYLAKADGSPDLDTQFIGGDVKLRVDADGKFNQPGLKPNEVRLVWDAKKDVPPEAEKIKTLHVTAELEPMTKDVEIGCHNGKMIGEAHGIGEGSNVTAKVVSFLGIPFAHPPTNDFNEVGDVSHIRRWKAPEWAPTNWEARIEAKRFAPSPLQPVGLDETSSSARRSEDCLYLNLWTGYTDDKDPIKKGANKPVLVFIHGGAFRHGGSSESLYDGRYLAEKYGDVIFVTITYRLGLLAEFDFSDIEGWKESDYPDHGRLCLKDQQMALQWIRENVAAFGGCPTNITIAGESAGGISIFYLMAKYNHDESGNQLFQKAIPMSGAAGGSSRECYTNALHGSALCAALALTQGKAVGTYKSVDALQKATENELMAAYLCPLEKVRAAGVDAKAQLLSDNKVVYDLYMGLLVEGREGDEESTKYAAAGVNIYDTIATVTNAVDLLTGDVGNESRYWAFCSYGMPSAEHPFDFYYNGYLKGTWDSMTNALPADKKGIIGECIQDAGKPGTPFYEPDDDDPNMNFGKKDLWCQTEILSELQFRLPQIRLAENYSTNAAAVKAHKGCYMYLFEKEQVRPDKPWARSMHASELPYLFNQPYFTDYGPLNNGLLDRFSEMVIEFVRDGVPKFRNADGDGLQPVPAYGMMDGRKTVVIRNVESGADPVWSSCTIEVVNDPRRERRRKLMPVSLALPTASKK